MNEHIRSIAISDNPRPRRKPRSSPPVLTRRGLEIALGLEIGSVSYNQFMREYMRAYRVHKKTTAAKEKANA